MYDIKPHVYRSLFGQRIRALRLKLGFSQEELGAKAGLHRTYIGSIERGEQNLSLDNIVKLAWALGVQPTELMPALGEDQSGV